MDKIRFNGRNLIKMADTKVNEVQMHLNWLSTYLFFYIKTTALGGVGHEI